MRPTVTDAQVLAVLDAFAAIYPAAYGPDYVDLAARIPCAPCTVRHAVRRLIAAGVLRRDGRSIVRVLDTS